MGSMVDCRYRKSRQFAQVEAMSAQCDLEPDRKDGWLYGCLDIDEDMTRLRSEAVRWWPVIGPWIFESD